MTATAATVYFETGKTYGAWNHDFARTIERRTPCYVWINGCKRLTKMQLIDGNLVEYVTVNGRKFFALCDWDWIQ